MNATDEKAEIAKTILQQLGGNRFRAMTGAKDFMALESGLAFRIPGQGVAKDGINKVQVVLDPSDTYTVKAFRIWKRRRGPIYPKLIGEHSGVYNVNLAAVFTDLTGLETHL